MQVPPPNGLVTLLTDFGGRDPYVGIMKGMIKREHAKADIVDLCHDVPAQQISIGALFLGAAQERFPTGTVHVAVVDPGVGTSRRVLAVCSGGCYWVGPDNGLLSAVLPRGDAGEVRVADLDSLQLVPKSNTFHGRDIFAPLGAMLASGRYGFRAVGRRVDDAARIEEFTGERVVLVDHFGNLITGVPAIELARRGITSVEIKGKRATLHRTYADVAPGELLALVNSYDLLEIAVSGGDAAAVLQAGRGDAVVLHAEENS